MTNSDKNLITSLWHEEITEAVFRDHFRGDLKTPSDYIKSELANCIENKDGDLLEYTLLLARLLHVFDLVLIPQLIEILPQAWHHNHEDIVLDFEKFKDARTIDVLFETATKQYDYLDYDEDFGLARKCTWALAKINSDASFQKLNLLAQSENLIIAGFAKKRL